MSSTVDICRLLLPFLLTTMLRYALRWQPWPKSTIELPHPENVSPSPAIRPSHVPRCWSTKVERVISGSAFGRLHNWEYHNLTLVLMISAAETAGPWNDDRVWIEPGSPAPNLLRYSAPLLLNLEFY
jgi:hypothetical protein